MQSSVSLFRQGRSPNRDIREGNNMNSASQKMGACLLVLSTTVLLSAPAWADSLFTATLSGPAAASTSAATGTAALILNAAETEVSYVIEYSGLEAAETAAHFHNAPPEASGGVIFTLPLGSPKVGVWTITPPQVVELQAGRVYVNIHSMNFGGGEIRGNLVFDSVAEEAHSWGSIKALYQ
jgi:hypothetical protein